LHTQKLGNNAKNIGIAHDSSLNVTTMVDGELKVPKVQNDCEKLTRLSYMSLG